MQAVRDLGQWLRIRPGLARMRREMQDLLKRIEAGDADAAMQLAKVLERENAGRAEGIGRLFYERLLEPEVVGWRPSEVERREAYDWIRTRFPTLDHEVYAPLLLALGQAGEPPALAACLEILRLPAIRLGEHELAQAAVAIRDYLAWDVNHAVEATLAAALWSEFGAAPASEVFRDRLRALRPAWTSLHWASTYETALRALVDAETRHADDIGRRPGDAGSA